MFRYALTYGAIAGAIIIVMMIGVMTLGGVMTEGAHADFAMSETLGYLVMVVVLSLIFIGMKRYRDVEMGGVIAFVPAFKLGLGIALVAAIAYIVSWEIYLAITDYAFIDVYADSMIASIEADSLSAQAEADKLAEVEWARNIYGNPLTRMAISFIEIFPVGLIVALISALLLKNPKLLPAHTRA